MKSHFGTGGLFTVSKFIRIANTPFTYAWSSPERLLGGPVTAEGDVFALGVLIWELVTCDLPYNDSNGKYRARNYPLHLCSNHKLCSQNHILCSKQPTSFIVGKSELRASIIYSSMRPTIPESLPGAKVPALCIALIRRCWSASELSRPNAEKVYLDLCDVKACEKCNECPLWREAGGCSCSKFLLCALCMLYYHRLPKRR